jgi:hypothetical protein
LTALIGWKILYVRFSSMRQAGSGSMLDPGAEGAFSTIRCWKLVSHPLLDLAQQVVTQISISAV